MKTAKTEQIKHFEELKQSYLIQIEELENQLREQVAAIFYYKQIKKRWEERGILDQEYRYAEMAIDGIGCKVHTIGQQIEEKKSIVRYLESRIKKEEE